MRTFEGGARWIYNESRRVGLGFVRVEKATLLSTLDQRDTKNCRKWEWWNERKRKL